MVNGWRTVKLSEVMQLDVDAVPVADLPEFPIAGVYSFARGLFKRKALPNTQTTYKFFHRLHKDMFVISTPKAWEGALARVTDEFDGWFLSPVFPTFRADIEKLDIKYFEWYCRQAPVWDRLRRKSRGMGARRESVSSQKFLTLEIPLPSLDEQRRIVARIETLAGRIAEAKSLRDEIDHEIELLLRAIITDDREITPTPLNQLVRLRKPDVEVTSNEYYQFAGVYSFGRGVFKSVRKRGDEFKYPKLTRIKTNNFTYPKLMAWEGAYGIVPPECNGFVVSTEFPVFELNQEKILPETMDVYFRNPVIWGELSGQSTGTNVRRRRLNPKTFLAYEFPLPSMKTQRLLQDVSQSVSSMRRLQSESQAELDALLPSVLDRAFNGEL